MSYSAIQGLADVGSSHAEPALARIAHWLTRTVGHCGVATLSTVGLEPKQYQITGLCHADGVLAVAAPDPLRPTQALPISSADCIERWRADPGAQLGHANADDWRSIFSGELASYRSALAIPLFLGGRVEHWILLLRQETGSFERFDWGQAGLLANLAGVSLARGAENRQLRAANQWIDSELREIGSLQESLLPPLDTSIRGVEFAIKYQAYRRVGGDYYDIAELSALLDEAYPSDLPALWGIIIADVTGHGAAAAMEAAMLDAILRTYRGDLNAGPAAVFDYANRYFFTRQNRGKFITAFIANYDPRFRLLRYSSAGHPPPLLKRGGRPAALEWLDASLDIPLGVVKSYEWNNRTIPLNPGDLLILYTDGVTDARSAEGQAFGAERLEQAVTQSNPDPHSVLAAIEQALEEHLRGCSGNDDQTIIVIQPTDVP